MSSFTALTEYIIYSCFYFLITLFSTSSSEILLKNITKCFFNFFVAFFNFLWHISLLDSIFCIFSSIFGFFIAFSSFFWDFTFLKSFIYCKSKFFKTLSGFLRNICVFEEIIDHIFCFQIAFFSFLIDVTIINHNINGIFGRLITLFNCIFGCFIAFL